MRLSPALAVALLLAPALAVPGAATAPPETIVVAIIDTGLDATRRLRPTRR